MKFDQVAILLTCHSFQDFPVHPTGAQADSLLASWTALWHPLLIANCGQMPTWLRADELPAHDRARLLTLPSSEDVGLAPQAAEQIQAAGGRLIRGESSRAAILAQALEGWASPQQVDQNLADDFLALGYAYLQIELLTRQMRYATRVAETAFADNVVAAAAAAVSGEDERARSLLQSCFDFLSQERDHYYAVDVYLMDLSLVAEGLLGDPLWRELDRAEKCNLLIEGRLLEPLQRDWPASFQALQAAVSEQRAGLVGGEYRELPSALLALETISRQFELGLETFTHSVGQRPKTYGRRTFGLTSALPQILLRLGYAGALHATFDGGRFPEATQAKSRWEGDGQFSIDGIMRAPLDATASATFLGLAIKLGESMDMDHIATRSFVHWVGQASPWYDELRRVTRYTRALGRFVTVDDYFRETYDPGIHDRCEANQYRSPYLEQRAAAGDPRGISQWIEYWQQHLALQSWVNCSALLALVDRSPASVAQYERAHGLWREFGADPLASHWAERLAPLPAELERSARALARALGVAPNEPAATADEATAVSTVPPPDQAVTGYALVNPASFPRRVRLDSARVLPSVEPPVYAVEPEPQHLRVVVDAPAIGLSTLRPQGRQRRASKSAPPLVEQQLLRNEFLEATVDPQTGGLRSLRDYGSRHNRLSQQLVFRQPSSSFRSLAPGGVPLDSRMVADCVEVLAADTVLGQIRSQGRLVNDEDHTLADFSQTVQVQRGSRVLEIELELQPRVSLTDDAWNSYFACRFAWSNEAADLSRSVNEIRRPATAKRFEAPLFVEIDDGQQRTTILSAGLPFHRRVGVRMLDSLLLVRGEARRQFRLGIAVDLKQPFREAIAFLSPAIVAPLHTPLADLTSAWLFHLDARNVFASTWHPVSETDRIVGVRARCVEAEGRSGTATLRSFRPLESARKVDGQNQTIEMCEVKSDQATFRMSPFEIVEIEARFAE
jgi:alpha-mannosidase